MKKSVLVILVLVCFSAIDFVLLQNHFFIQCQWESMARNTIHPVYCSDTASLLQSIFGMSASVAIASIIGLATFLSPKKGTILVGSIAGLIFLLWVVSEISYLSMPKTAPPTLHPMVGIERISVVLLQSPMPIFLLGAEILGAIVWVVVILRKKISKSI